VTHSAARRGPKMHRELVPEKPQRRRLGSCFVQPGSFQQRNDFFVLQRVGAVQVNQAEQVAAMPTGTGQVRSSAGAQSLAWKKAVSLATLRAYAPIAKLEERVAVHLHNRVHELQEIDERWLLLLQLLLQLLLTDVK
jgi:hypothetical protein